MNPVQWFSVDVLTTLVYALLHSVWLAGICAALLWILLRTMSGSRPGLRYAVSLGAMGLVVLSTLVTWSLGELNLASERGLDVTTQNVRGHTTESDELTDSASVPTIVESDSSHQAIGYKSEFASIPWTTWFALAWMLGSSLMLLRLCASITRARGLVRGSHSLDDSGLMKLIEQIHRELGIARHVRVLVCERVNVPAVLGVIWPVLLIPPSMLTGVPTNQLRAIVAHELAHIRRFDYLINLCQMFIESLLFFNPAVWWISRQIRIEREACCDALAVRSTGQPIEVARTLVDFADRIRKDSAQVPELAQAFASDSRPDSFFARVQRIVLPDDRPAIRLPWYSLLGIMFVCSAMMYGLEQGTDSVVASAAEWLMPPEQVKKLRELQKDYGEKDANRRFTKDEMVQVTVSVRMADGSPAPKDTSVHLNVRRVSAVFSHDLTRKEGKFSGLVQPGKTFIHAHANGFAPTYAEPISSKRGGAIDDIELVLSRGFSARVRIVDTKGKPVPRATIKGSFRHADGNIGFRNLTANDRGEADILNCASLPFEMQVEAPGFQFESRIIELSKTRTADYIVRRGKPTTGRVMSADTDEPIAGANIYLIEQRGDAKHRSYMPYGRSNQPPLLATTNKDGRYALKQLRDDCQYALMAEADGHAPILVTRVRAGLDNVDFQLGPERVIRGTIVGPLDQLDKSIFKDKKRKPNVHFSSEITIDNHSYNYGRRAEVEIRDGVGHFLIKDLLPGVVHLSVADRRLKLDPNPSIDDLKIDLSRPDPIAAAKAAMPTRTIVFRLQVAEGSAEPRGELRIDYIRPEHKHSYYPTWQPINNGEARIEVPVPTKVRYETGKLIGYRVDEKRAIEVFKGSEPMVIDVPTIPAGAIYGTILNPDGTVCEGFSLATISIEKPPEFTNKPLFVKTINSRRGDGKFIVPALPLGARYQLVVSEATTNTEAKIVSKILTIDEDKPIQEVTLQLVKGVTVTGQVVGPKGKPVTGATILLECSLPRGWGNSGVNRKTDRMGRFQFNRVNPDFPGTYRIVVDPTRDLQGHANEFKPTAKPMTIELKAGTSASGVLLDKATGRPIPNATITARPAAYKKGNYRGEIKTHTDSNGRFSFSNLEQRLYGLVVEGAKHPTIDVEKLPGGGTRLRFRADGGFWEVTGGQSKPVTLRAEILKERPN